MEEAYPGDIVLDGLVVQEAGALLEVDQPDGGLLGVVDKQKRGPDHLKERC